MRVPLVKVKSSSEDERLEVDSKPGGYGGTEAQESEEKPAQTRREQGYGPGSGVGA